MAAQQEDLILKAVINWISNQKVQDLKHLLGDDMNTEDGMANLQEQKKTDALSRSPLSSPHTGWKARGSYAVHSLHGSLSGCYEWMSLR